MLSQPWNVNTIFYELIMFNPPNIPIGCTEETGKAPKMRGETDSAEFSLPRQAKFPSVRGHESSCKKWLVSPSEEQNLSH